MGETNRTEDLVGHTIAGRYEVLAELGRGGMGAVYRAVHTGSGRRVALKIILGRADAPQLRARFQREARAAGQIHSRHVAQVLDVGVDEERDLPFIAIEFLEGQDLGALIARVGPLPSRLAAKIGAQVASALVKAHEQGIVHRDIKPANIFLAREDDEIVVKLLDFGVAKVLDGKLDGQVERLTSTGALLGSPLYMSPEQALGDRKVDERSDLWSLGIVLYEALSGASPFARCSGMGALLMEICSAPPAPVIARAPWVDARLSSLVARLLQLAPEARLGPAAAVGAALRELAPEGVAIMAQELAGDPNARSLVDAPAQGRPRPAGDTTSDGPAAPARSGGEAPAGSTTAAVSGPNPHLSAVAPPASRTARMGAAGVAIGALLAGVAVYATRVGSDPAPADGAGERVVAAASAPAGAVTTATAAPTAPGTTTTTAETAGAFTIDSLPTVPGGDAPKVTPAPAPAPSAAGPRRPGAAPSSAAPAPSASQRKNYGF